MSGVENSNGYQMEELLPVITWLARKYTGGESTSVTYEQARRLMEAVLYCIEEAGRGETQLTGGEKPSAFQMYEAGYRKVLMRTEKNREIYNTMILKFRSFGNENYRDTVEKGIPGFFRFYDARFAPQETILTMDYPVLDPVREETGIRAIEKYLEGICLEQKFLGKLPEAAVRRILTDFRRDYQKQFENLGRIVLRNILGRLLTGNMAEHSGPEAACEKVRMILNGSDKASMEQLLAGILEKLIREEYEDDRQLFRYLSMDLKDFTTALYNGAEHHHLDRVLVLR